MDTFTCPGCGKQYPVNKGVKIPVIASIGFFVITLGTPLLGTMCPDCDSAWVGFGVIGALFGSVLLIVVGAKWLWG